MADDTTATATPADQEGVVDGVKPDQESGDHAEHKSEMSVEDYRAALAKAREEAARYRVEQNALRQDAEAYREIKESEMTDLQKAQDALEEARAGQKQAETELQRARVLSQYGIAEGNADLLGSDPEAFEANAKRLAEIQAEAARKAAPPSETPVEGLVLGSGVPEPDRPDYAFPADWPINGPYADNN